MSSIDAFDATDSDRFVIHLTRKPNEAVQVSSVEIQTSDLRNRYTFKQQRELNEVFSPPLATALGEALGNLVRGERIVSIPDFSVSLPGVVLGGLRILRTKADNGVDMIMVRVREFVGTLKSAFRFDPAMVVDSISMRERIAVEVLRDIVNPLLDIMTIAQDAPAEVVQNNADTIRRQLSQMGSRQDEITFYTGLLKRYVAGCRSDSMQAATRRLGDLSEPCIGQN